MAKKLYLKGDISAVAGDIFYSSRADGSLDGKVTYGAMAAIFGSLLSLTFAAASHTHTASQITDFSAAADARIAAKIGVSVQAYSANLTTFAGIAPSANVQSILGGADYAAIRTLLGLVISTNVQAYSANLTTFAGIAPSANMQTFLGAANYAAMRTQLALTIGTDVQAYSANLTIYAGITPSANVQTLLGAASFAAFRSSLGLGAVALLATVTEADQTLADNTTGNVVSTRHGYAPKSPADATKFLNGAATPDYALVKDSDLSTSDVTTNNATTAKHGFLKKLSNTATEYMDGTGNWSVPAGGGGGAITVKEEGSTLTTALTSLDFVGKNITATNSSGAVTVTHKDFRGALVTKAADQTGANYTGTTRIAWDSESYDTDSIHDNVTNNTRLTVPSGVTKVRLSGNVSLNNVTSSVYVIVQIEKNGATTAYLGMGIQMTAVPAGFPNLNVSSPVLTVIAGDYFELRLAVQTDTSVDVLKDSSWFAMEIIE